MSTSTATATSTNTAMEAEQQPQQPSIRYISHPYAYVQELNQRASRLLEDRQYDEAIAALSKTLKLWKECDTYDRKAEGCLCPSCNPGTSICDDTKMDSITTRQIFQHHRHQYMSKQDSFQDNDELPEHPTGGDCGYVYHKLMQIPCRNSFETHNMGSAVALIVISNLAIVHHLQSTRLNSRTRMMKTLRLYQLANDCLASYIEDTYGSDCLQGADEIGLIFQMILLNNLSHLHSFMGHPSRSRKCTEELIPLVMCLVDDKVRNIAGRSCVDVCLECFFRNITPLVLTSQCADAA